MISCVLRRSQGVPEMMHHKFSTASREWDCMGKCKPLNSLRAAPGARGGSSIFIELYAECSWRDTWACHWLGDLRTLSGVNGTRKFKLERHIPAHMTPCFCMFVAVSSTWGPIRYSGAQGALEGVSHPTPRTRGHRGLRDAPVLPCKVARVLLVPAV